MGVGVGGSCVASSPPQDAPNKTTKTNSNRNVLFSMILLQSFLLEEYQTNQTFKINQIAWIVLYKTFYVSHTGY
jgi:hypothetical protein